MNNIITKPEQTEHITTRMDMSERFHRPFAIGDNFPQHEVVSLLLKTCTKWGLLKSFKSTPVSTPPVPSQKGSKYFHVKITSPECVSISFKGNEFYFKGSQLCEHCLPLI